MNARHLAWAIGCATAMAAAPALAEFKWTFNFSSGTNCLGANGTAACNFGNTRNASSTSVISGPGPAPALTSVTAQAWSNTQGGTIASPSSGPLETAYLPGWGGNGLGVQNRDMANFPSPTPAGLGDRGDAVEGSSPEHAMDNNQRSDSILFSFDGLGFKLTGVEIGWKTTDSDIFVLASNTGPSLGGLNYNQLTGNGWSLIGNYSNLAEDTKVAVNAAGVVAKYWLIGTGCYSAASGVSNCGDSKDYVKLLALYGEPGRDRKVPEPGTALLFGVAALAAWRVRPKRLAS